MSRRMGLTILAASALVDLLLVWAWGSPSVTAAVLIVAIRLIVPVLGVVARQRWVLYAGAFLALALSVVFWIVVFLIPLVPIACLFIARGIDVAPRGPAEAVEVAPRESST